MIKKIKENLDVIGLGAVAIAVFAGAIFLSEENEHSKQKLEDQLAKTSELIESKLIIDIKEQTNIELSDGFEIDLTGINLNNGKGFIADSQKSLDLYSISNQELAFKTTYNLTDEQVRALTIGREREIIASLGKIFSQLELTNIEVKDLEAMSLGLEDEKDFNKIAKAFGPADKAHSMFKSRHSQNTPDAFIPVFSKIDIKENNGNKTATLIVDGLEFHNKRRPNFGFGFIMGRAIFNITDNRSLSYVFGVATAYSASFNNNDIYSRTEEITVDLTEEHENMTEKELREYIVNGMLENTIEFETTTTRYSENLSKNRNRNKAYSNVIEQGRTK